jgi:O-antigen/teichoic acid export membrane protein
MTIAARASVWSDHWNYARWSGATGALTWFYSFIYYLVLPKWYGLAASGLLKALMNLITPILHSDGALVTLLLPQFVRSRRVAGRFPRLVLATTAGFMFEAACYWFMLGFVGERLVTLLYGATFHFDRSTLVLIGAIPPLTSLVNILGNALRAREEPEGVFWSTIGAVVGAIIGMVSSGVVQVGVMLWLLSKIPSHASAMPASEPRIVGDAVA